MLGFTMFVRTKPQQMKECRENKYRSVEVYATSRTPFSHQNIPFYTTYNFITFK